MRCERGQATIEWVGLVLLASLVLGALAAAVPVIDGRSFGGFLSHRLVCAVKGSACEESDGSLARAYGQRDAELLRRFMPGIVYEPGEAQIPVDFRECRSVRCAEAPLDRDLDVHRSNAGRRATVFTRVIRRGGRTYLQYWLYYPDSNSTFAGSDLPWKLAGRPRDYPGYHDDDWEGHTVRLDRDGRAYVRSTAHGHWQWCKQATCRDRWGPRTGWTRVSRGSHAGHIPLDRNAGRRRGGRAGGRGPRRVRYRARLPGVDLRERTTTAEGLRLVPLETIDRRHYRALDPAVKPPWLKEAYEDPETPHS